jgi:CheY-like chemotaxis protein
VGAITRFQELKREVMTLDIMMPEKDGLAANKEIIALDRSARVIMCAALGQESKVLESIKLCAKGLRGQSVPGRPCPRGDRQGARVRRAPPGAQGVVIPTPTSVSSNGLPAASEWIRSEARRFPGAVGLNRIRKPLMPVG